MSLDTMSPRGQQLARAMQINLKLIQDHEKRFPAESEEIIAMLVEHIRSLRPMLLTRLK